MNKVSVDGVGQNDTPTTQVKKRLQYVDMARGIAMICIVLGHLKNPILNRFVYTFHVPIFYFITGFFTNDKKPVGEFVKNKAKTLLVPYAVTCGVMILIGTLIGLHNGDGSAFGKWVYAAVYGAGDTWQDPFYIKGIGAIWFLWATFWGSIFLRISLKFNKVARKIFIFGLFVAGYYSRFYIWLPLSIQAGACAVLFMYMGYLLKKSSETLHKIPTEVKIFGFIFAVIVWLNFIGSFQSFWLVHCDIGRGIVDIFGTMCACSVLMFLCWFAERKNFFLVKPLALIGKYSLIFLCVHITELTFVPWWKMAEHFTGITGLPEWTQLAFVITGKLVTDLFITWVCVKIKPVRKIMGYK